MLAFAERALKLGAGGITVHPRQDQRHALYADVRDLSALLRDWPEAELNIEGCPVPEFLEVVHEVQPDQCTLLPDTPDQLTSDLGGTLRRTASESLPLFGICDLREFASASSWTLIPDRFGAFPTSAPTASNFTLRPTPPLISRDAVLDRFWRAAETARSLGLGVNAGHDLNLKNLAEFLCIPEILEVSIGHAITVESLEYGWDKTVCRYLEIVARTVG